MAKTSFTTPADYLASLDADDRALVEAVMGAIRAAVPEAEETISYQLPAFRDHGWVLYVSVAKKHVALSCPPPFTVFDEFASELAAYGRTKSAIQLPKSEPLPLDLIGAMAAFRAKENRTRASA